MYQTVSLEVSEQVLFIGQALMQLQLIKYAAVQPRIQQSVVLITLLVLLPLEIDEGTGRVFLLYPACSGGQYSPDEILVIPLAHIELNYQTQLHSIVSNCCGRTFLSRRSCSQSGWDSLYCLSWLAQCELWRRCGQICFQNQ